MIPKIIHYCWFGNDMPILYEKCIESWSKYASDFQIILWNEENMPINSFTEYHLKKKNYAFLSDYVRFYAVYNYGGIYLDSDIELIKDLNEISLKYEFLVEEAEFRPTAGVFGGFVNSNFSYACMQLLERRHYDKQTYLIIPDICMKVLEEGTFKNLKIYKKEMFYPYNPYDNNPYFRDFTFSLITSKTIGIHHWGKSWHQSLITKIINKLLKLFNKK